jgi:hypothetical protein
MRVLAAEEVTGSDLLLMAFPTPTLFHRNSAAIFYDENLCAGEDAHYLQQLLDHFKTKRIFNVPQSLIDIFPQPRLRVNNNSQGMWQATEAIYRDFAPAYGVEAAEAFLARSQLGCLKLQPGGFRLMVKSACRLTRLRGRKELRFILNCFLFKVPFARRFLVS